MSTSSPIAPSKRRDTGRALALDTALVLFTQLIAKTRAFITLPLVGKQLGAEAYGVWTQFLAVASLLAPVFGLCLHQALIRLGAERHAQRSPLFATLSLFTLLTSLAVLFAMVLGGPYASLLIFGSSSYDSFLVPAALLVAATNFRLLAFGVFRLAGRIWGVSVVNLAATVGGTMLFASVMVARRNLLLASTVLALTELAVSAIAMVYGFRMVGWKGASPTMVLFRDSLAYSLPLVPAQLSAWAMDRSDRFIIATFHGEAAVGIYSASYALASSLLLLIMPVHTTVVPRLALLWEAERDRAIRMIALCKRGFAAAAILFTATVPLIAEPLLVRLGGAQLASDAALLTLLVSVGIGLWGFNTFQALILYATKDTASIGRLNGWGAAINLALSLLLIPYFSIRGAACATIGGYTFMVFAQSKMAAQKDERLSIGGVFIARCLLCSAAPATALLLLRPAELPAIVAAGLGSVLLYSACLVLSKTVSLADIRVQLQR